MKGLAGPVPGHDRLPPVIDDPGGVVTQELVAADRGSLIEARQPQPALQAGGGLVF